MLPKDPYILLSTVNTYLRDLYDSLEALCEDLGTDAESLKEQLAAAVTAGTGNRMISSACFLLTPHASRTIIFANMTGKGDHEYADPGTRA